MKKVIVTLMVLLLAFSLVFASGSNEATGAKKHLTMLMYSSASVQAQLKEVLAPFEEANNCEVEVIIVPKAEYLQKITTMISSGNAPDVYWAAEYATAQYYSLGLLTDLSDFEKDAEWDGADFAAGQKAHWTIDGKLVGVPFSGPPIVCFYNKTAIEAAGLKTPTELYEAGEWTADAMLDIARKVADVKNGLYGIDFTRGGVWGDWDTPLTPVLRLYGGDAWSEDFKTVLINSEASVKGLQAYYDLLFVDKVHPMPGTAVDFLSGQVALAPLYFSSITKMKDLSFEFGVVPMPSDGKGGISSYAGNAAYAVCPSTKNMDLAKAMVKFLTSKKVSAALEDTFVPVRMSVITSEEYRTGHNGQIPRPDAKSFDYCITETFPLVRVKLSHPNYDELRQAMNADLDLMYTQQLTAKEVADVLAKTMEPLMVK